MVGGGTFCQGLPLLTARAFSIVSKVNSVNNVINNLNFLLPKGRLPMPELFDKHGGFRRLHSFTLATIIQLETLRFCRRFLTQDHREAGVRFYDPKGRQYDQMTQAARSGRQNIIEGSERSSTSKDTEMKLTDVARASLSELRGDFEMVILDRGELPWSVHHPEAKALHTVSLDLPTFELDVVHESARHALDQRKKYARWLDDDDVVVVANAMLLVIGRAMTMLKNQIEAQGRAFEETGGFSERLTTKRVEKRDQQRNHQNAPEAPNCPQCAKPMRRRKSAKGDFWGCSGYPECNGTRPV
jgi:restriction system protein